MPLHIRLLDLAHYMLHDLHRFPLASQEIKYDDQNRVRDGLAGKRVDDDVDDESDEDADPSYGKTKKKAAYVIGTYAVENAKTGMSVCRGCELPIAERELRCGPVEPLEGRAWVGVPAWHHFKVRMSCVCMYLCVRVCVRARGVCVFARVACVCSRAWHVRVLQGNFISEGMYLPVV